MEQTAVDFIKKSIEEDSDTSFLNIDWNRFDEIIKQAKQMEKQQIIKNSVGLAKLIICNPIEKSGKTFQELMDAYFKQTFKSE
jgi:hypothetical protein